MIVGFDEIYKIPRPFANSLPYSVASPPLQLVPSLFLQVFRQQYFDQSGESPRFIEFGAHNWI